jgi:hypothetical protein
MDEIEKIKKNIEQFKLEIQNLIRNKNEMEKVYQNSFENEKLAIINQFNELVEQKENEKNIFIEKLRQEFTNNIEKIEEKNKELFEMNQKLEVSSKDFTKLKSECRVLKEKHESMLENLEEYEVCKVKNNELLKKINDINVEHMNLLANYNLLKREISICQENNINLNHQQKEEKLNLLEDLLKKNDDEYKNISERNELKKEFDLNLINEQDELINQIEIEFYDKIKEIEYLIQNKIKFKDDNQKRFYMNKLELIKSNKKNDIDNLYDELKKSIYCVSNIDFEKCQNINKKLSDSNIDNYKIQKVQKEFESSIILNYGKDLDVGLIDEIVSIFEIYGECNAVDLKKDPPLIDFPKVYHLFGNIKFFDSIDHSKFIVEDNIFNSIREYRIKQGRIINIFGKTFSRSFLVSVIKTKEGRYITNLNIPSKEYPNDILLKYFTQFIPNLTKPLISISSFLSYTKNEVQKLIMNRLKLKYTNKDIHLIYKDGNELHIPSTSEKKHVKINIDVNFEEISKFLKESLFLNEMSEHVRYFLRADNIVSLNKLVSNKLGNYSTQNIDLYNPYLCFSNPTKSIISRLYSKIESFTITFPKRLLLCHLENSDDCDEVLQMLMYIDGMVIDEKKIEETGFVWSYFFL